MIEKIFSFLNYFDRRLLINIGIVVAVIVFFVTICLIPSFKADRALHKKLTELENNITRSVKKISEYPGLQAEKQTTGKLVQAYMDRLINEGQQTGLIGEISELAKRCNVKIVSIKPSSYEKQLPQGFTTYFKPYTYELLIESGYHEFGTFLNLVENYHIMLSVEQINIKPSEDDEHIHSITIFLTTYVKV
jgi:Tfp pilus assembly protein PilO